VLLFLIPIWLGLIGFATAFTSISNRKKRAVICTLGVILLAPEGSKSFRWEDVLTTTRRVESDSESQTSLGSYTVHCHDGRKIIFNGFAHMEDLAEAIDVQVARARQPS
jgi:hypothetical protein